MIDKCVKDGNHSMMGLVIVISVTLLGCCMPSMMVLRVSLRKSRLAGTLMPKQPTAVTSAIT